MQPVRILVCAGIALFGPLAIAQSSIAARPTVAISSLDRAAATPSWFDDQAFRSMLETSIVSTNKFRLIERSQLSAIDSERALVDSGAVRAGGVGDKVDAADYLIYGRITHFNFAGIPTGELGVAQALGQIVTGTPAEKPQPFMMSVDLKITDLKSGAVRYADSISRTVTAQRIKNRSPLSLPVVTEIQRDVAESIARELAFTVYPISVVDVKAKSVTLNYGLGILRAGEVLKVYTTGKPIVDPFTKELLGSSETEVAEIMVDNVQPKISLAKIRKGRSEDIVVGSIARLIPTK